MFLFNSRYYMASDGGGKSGMDPHWGIFGGKDEIFDVTDTGFVKPTFVDDDGNMLFDEDGFPIHTDFMLGFRGQHYFRGIVNALGGKFRGDVYTNNFFFNDGDNIRTLLDQVTKKFDLSSLDQIDLGGILLNGITGDIDMTGNLNLSGVSKINFGGNAFVKTRYSTNKNAAIPGGWTETWNDGWTGASNLEVYVIHSYDGGETWIGPTLFQGKNGERGADGSNGSDADVTFANIKSALQKAASTQTTFITADSAGSPNIYGGNIYGANIYAGTGSDSFAKMDESGFYVYVDGVERPKISMESTAGGDVVNLFLGAGSTSGWNNRLQIIKSSAYAGLLYHTQNGDISGFEFNSDGTITAKGNLKVTTVLA